MLQVRRADVKVGKPAETEAAMGLIKGLLSSPPLLLQVALFLSLLKKMTLQRLPSFPVTSKQDGVRQRGEFLSVSSSLE